LKDRCDAAITAAPQIDGLVRQGKIAGGRVILAKVGIGVFVRKGAPKPEIGSADALEASLLAATIVYTDPAVRPGFMWPSCWIGSALLQRRSPRPN
jgi:molybdate transport system substrate-binding protein